MSKNAKYWVDKLDLEPHPEGGYFKETWRSERVLELEEYEGPRHAGTCIYFLLETGQRSAWHRVASDELWLWHAGDPMRLSIRGGETHVLGEDRFQVVVPAGEWQSSEPADGPHGYSLVGCVVVPGFDFADFEMEESDHR